MLGEVFIYLWQMTSVFGPRKKVTIFNASVGEEYGMTKKPELFNQNIRGVLDNGNMLTVELRCEMIIL